MQVGPSVWLDPTSPLFATYTHLMQAAGGAGGVGALRATVAQIPLLASVLGASCAYEQLLPPLMVLFPDKIDQLRGVLASRWEAVSLCTITPMFNENCLHAIKYFIKHLTA